MQERSRNDTMNVTRQVFSARVQQWVFHIGLFAVLYDSQYREFQEAAIILLMGLVNMKNVLYWE